MTPKQNERYLKRKREKALAEFYSQSVGLQWMVAVAIKQHLQAAKLTEKLKRR